MRTAKTGIISLLLLIFAVSLASAVTMPINSTNVNHTIVVSNLPEGADVQFVMNGGVPVPTKADDNGTAKYLPLIEGTLEIIAMSNGNELSGYNVTIIPTATPTVTATATATVTATATATTPPTGGGPSGGGGGGGGVVTGEPFDNILMYLTIDGDLIANNSTLYNFSRMPDLGIYEMLVTGYETENGVSIRVELLKNTSKLVNVPPDGMVYKNANIWSGSKRIKEGLIRFKVDNNWITGSGGGSGDVKMLKWDGSNWIQLETVEMTKDAAYTYYEAKTNTFSPFAISSLKGRVVPTTPAVTTTVTRTTTPIATPTAAAKPPTIQWSYILIILIVVIVVVSYIYMVVRKKK